MSLERALQINTATLAALGAVFLGLAHDSAVIPLVLSTAAVAAVGLTDILRWLRLNRLLANVIALIAVAWSMHDFFQAGSEQLLAIANMLVYLQIVLLFQEKTARVFWQLIVLSLLQVVVAGALDLGPQFGLLLSAYIVLALSALVLLCIYRELHQEPAPRLRGRAAQLLNVPPFLWLMRVWGKREATPSPPAWEVLLAAPVVEPPPRAAAAGSALTPRTIARQVALLAVATFLFTSVFFYATPRISDSAWSSAKAQNGALSSFTPEVRLDVSGKIFLGSQVVMRVALSRLTDRQPVTLVGDPYFAGTALTDYVVDELGSRWVMPIPAGRGRGGFRPPSSLTSTNLVRQDIVLETAHAGGFFAMMPAERCQDTPREMRVRRGLHRIDYRENDSPALGRQFRYALATPAIASGRQVRGIPHANPALSEADEFQLGAELESLRSFDADRFPQLAQAAATAIREAAVMDGTDLAKALALEQHFKASARYRYSLNLMPPRQTDIDPIENFVAHHHQGHCEYFASALVMMLRSQGIPARMVVGYKGGEFNSLGRYYIVQQRHAHAWVEAWLPAGALDEREIAGIPSAGGTWFRLDPTPAAARELYAGGEDDSLGHRVSQAFDYAELLWRDYVLSLTAERQQDALFDPLTSRASAIPAWAEGRSLQRWLRRWSSRLGFEPGPGAERGSRRAFELSIALVVAAVLLVGLVLWRLVVWLRSRTGTWLGGRWVAGGPAAHAPEFYLRLERLLARAGLRRGRCQTPQELAAAARQRLAASTGSLVAGVPAQLVDVYYRVRFGGDRLDNREIDAIEHALEVLAPAVNQVGKR